MSATGRVPGWAQALPQTQAALHYAARLHAGQSRTVDGAPFIMHPREVASLLHRASALDHLIAAGALHDVIEKTPATAFDLRERFGSRIAALVLAVSEDERIAGYAARKAALRERVADAGREALMLFAADKLSKARELRIITHAATPRGTRGALARRARSQRMAHYRACLALLQERLPEWPLVTELNAELEGLGGYRRPRVRRSTANSSGPTEAPAGVRDQELSDLAVSGA